MDEGDLEGKTIQVSTGVNRSLGYLWFCTGINELRYRVGWVSTGLDR